MSKNFLPGCLLASAMISVASAESRPNIFIAISDDQSWPHASAYGCEFVETPNFDRVAREGVLFTRAFCASPGCSPSRAALLTGLNTWQLEHAGTHASYFAVKYETFADRLQAAGYHVGYTGKGWGPGDATALGRTENPAGPRFDAKKTSAGRVDYATAFEEFLASREAGQPFCFWFGSTDPHRTYEKGSGLAAGKTLGMVAVPPFLPDAPEVRSDLLDYAVEIERFDDDLGRMLTLLEESGELDNTLVVVTSDNGMPFPRAKANCYEYGAHVPLAIRWASDCPPGRKIDDLVGFTDLTATIYDATGVDPPAEQLLVGKALTDMLRSDASGLVESDRKSVYFARERHSSSRYKSLGYPQRAIRTQQYLYIFNFRPERWPAGTPQKFDRVTYDAEGKVAASQLGDPHGGYHDIDGCPTLTYMIDHRDDPETRRYLDLAVAHRPAIELYDIESDPGCLDNLIERPELRTIREELAIRLNAYLLLTTGDPRATGKGDVWETYPRVSKLRWFPRPAWANEDPQRAPVQPWLEKRRPRE